MRRITIRTLVLYVDVLYIYTTCRYVVSYLSHVLIWIRTHRYVTYVPIFYLGLVDIILVDLELLELVPAHSWLTAEAA